MQFKVIFRHKLIFARKSQKIRYKFITNRDDKQLGAEIEEFLKAPVKAIWQIEINKEI